MTRGRWRGVARKAAFAAAILAPLFPHAAAAQDAKEFLKPFGNVALRDPAPTAPGAKPDFYSQTGPDPDWQIGQWEIPGERLPAFRTEVRDGRTIFATSTPSASVRITRSTAGEVVQLSQNGRVLPCSRKDGSAREFDLLLSPMERWHVGNSAFHTDRLKLRDMRRLEIATKVKLVFGPVAAEPVCKVNVAAAGAGVVLTDLDTKPSQTLFYQLDFAGVCGRGDPTWVHNCEQGGLRKSSYFFTKNPFGVQDRLPLVGEPFFTSGEERQVRVDLLARIESLIRSGPAGMDRNPDHWLLDGVFMGNGLWGKYRMSSTWHSFQLLYTPR